jgi:uncharacterized coiled-coil DUF342 family protein
MDERTTMATKRDRLEQIGQLASLIEIRDEAKDEYDELAAELAEAKRLHVASAHRFTKADEDLRTHMEAMGLPVYGGDDD